MISSDKISKDFQVVIPFEFRKKYDIRSDNIIEWIGTDDGIKLIFEKN